MNFSSVVLFIFRNVPLFCSAWILHSVIDMSFRCRRQITVMKACTRKAEDVVTQVKSHRGCCNIDSKIYSNNTQTWAHGRDLKAPEDLKALGMQAFLSLIRMLSVASLLLIPLSPQLWRRSS